MHSVQDEKNQVEWEIDLHDSSNRITCKKNIHTAFTDIDKGQFVKDGLQPRIDWIKTYKTVCNAVNRWHNSGLVMKTGNDVTK